MNENSGAGLGRPRRGARARTVLPAAVLGAITVLAAACGGGGSSKAGSSSGSSGVTVQTIDAFAMCMRGHGVPDFYLSRPTGTPSPNGPPVLSILGYQVTGVNPQTSQFQSAMKSCRHVLGIRPPSPGVEHKQFVQLLRAAACMRSHGYPDWPDPRWARTARGSWTPARRPGWTLTRRGFRPQRRPAGRVCRDRRLAAGRRARHLAGRGRPAGCGLRRRLRGLRRPSGAGIGRGDSTHRSSRPRGVPGTCPAMTKGGTRP